MEEPGGFESHFGSSMLASVRHKSHVSKEDYGMVPVVHESVHLPNQIHKGYRATFRALLCEALDIKAFTLL